MHGIVHFPVAAQKRRIGKQGMGSVQKAELHVLVSRNIGSKLRSDLFPCRPSGNEIILDHPLYEILTIYRRIVISPVLFVQADNIFRSRGRSDTVHHAVRESDIILYP